MTIEQRYSVQNTCACVAWNEEDRCWQESGDCFGCWEEFTEDFDFTTQCLFESDNYDGWFRIEGFPVWNGTRGGIFPAKNWEQLLNSITPDRTEWRLDYAVENETLTGWLSHHDACGTITVTLIRDPDA